MTQFSPTALEEAAKAIYETWARNRSIDETWFGVCHVQHSIANEARQEATAAITAYLAQREKEGFVEVPKEASEEIVNAALDKHAEITPCESPFGPDGYFALLYRAMVAAAQNGGE